DASAGRIAKTAEILCWKARMTLGEDITTATTEFCLAAKSLLIRRSSGNTISWRATCLMDAACIGAPIWQGSCSRPFGKRLGAHLHNMHKMHNENHAIFVVSNS